MLNIGQSFSYFLGGDIMSKAVFNKKLTYCYKFTFICIIFQLLYFSTLPTAVTNNT